MQASALLSCLSALAGALSATAPIQTVHFKSDDGWTIAAEYAAAKKDRPTAILAHGVAAGRGEYAAFASTLQARGWGTLALDLRGHGGSSQGPKGPQDFKGFDAAGEWPRAAQDVMAAARFLERKGVPEKKLVLVGASIGANLCSHAFTTLSAARALVLLSPGIDYRGVGLARFDARRAVAAASASDQYAHATVLKLKELLPALTTLEAKSGHGAQMLADPGFLSALLAALDRLADKTGP